MSPGKTLCILGCGNLGTAILKSLLLGIGRKQETLPFTRFIACVRSTRSEKRLTDQFAKWKGDSLHIFKNSNVEAVQQSDVTILGADPADIEAVLKQPGLSQALQGKLVISVVVGWTRQKLEDLIRSQWNKNEQEPRPLWVVRTLPNIAALVSQGLTAIEDPHPDMPPQYLTIVESIFEQVGKVVRVKPELINAATAVGGSTPAFFAVICDAMIDAAVAVGVPRATAQAMIYQSMQGTAAMLQSGIHPGLLKDQGTSPEGCTIGGLMVLEEGAVRGHIGRALRESVTIARLMETTPHVNDTRR